MNCTIKLNNVKPKDIIFSSGHENIIYSKNIVEEISGLITLDIGNESIFCEKVQDDYVKVMMSVDGDTFSNVYFKIMEGNDSVILSKNYTKFKPPGILLESKSQKLSLPPVSYTKVTQDSEKNISLLKKEIYNLKKELNKHKLLILESSDNIVGDTDFKTNLLQEHLNFVQKQKSIVKESIKIIYTECVNALTEQLDSKKAQLSNTLENRIKTLEKKIISIQEKELAKQEKIITERVDEYSNFMRDFVKESVQNTKKAFVNIVEDQKEAVSSIIVENSTKEIDRVKRELDKEYSITLENITNKLNSIAEDQKKNILSSILTSSTQEISNFKEEIKKEFKVINEHTAEAILREKEEELHSFVNLKIKELSDSLDYSIADRIKNNLLFVENTLEPINEKVLGIENRIVQLESLATDIVEKKKIEMLSQVEDYIKIVEEHNTSIKTKIKDFEKKAQEILNEKRQAKQQFQQQLSEAKRYTDSKVKEAISESMLYARKMLDFAGGGGAIAVQYAAGGKINGELEVDTLVANTLLSGDGRNMTEIFAGEGEGDTNALDGGLI